MIFKKEMRKGFKGTLIWTLAITFMLLVCVFLYPEMKNQMEGLNQMFADMGAFTQAFSMDRLDFGTLIGFYGVECGNILGLGGSFFAAYIGITMIAKEEKDHTAEFLLSHPVSRTGVLFQKLTAVLCQIEVLNIVALAAGVISILLIGEELPIKELLLLHVAYFILQIEIGFVSFGLSAFIRRGSIGIGLGGAAILYFMNIIMNISEEAEFLKYITPFAYAEPSDIVADMSVDLGLMALGLLYSAAAVAAGFIYYNKKDIRA